MIYEPFFDHKVSMSMLIKEAVAHESLIGIAIKPHLVRKSKG